MVQMISESKRKIAALALAGAMAIGGAAGVATTIASPAQNQSGIVMEAEAATIKPKDVDSATAGNVIMKSGYNVYYDTGYSSQYYIRFNPSWYEYTSISTLQPKVVASDGTLKDLSTENLVATHVNNNGMCYRIRSTDTSAYKIVTVRFFGHKNKKKPDGTYVYPTSKASSYGYNDVTLYVVNRSKIRVKMSGNPTQVNGLWCVKFVPYYDSKGLTSNTSDDVAIPNCTIKATVENRTSGNSFNRELRARCAAGAVLTQASGSATYTFTDLRKGDYKFTFKIADTNATLNSVTKKINV